MKKIYFTILLLFLTVNLYGSPTTSMSIVPVAVDRATILADDENSRNSVVSSTYNAHTHEDITKLGTVTTGVWNGTEVAVLYGGTGSTTASGARINLGLAIGTDVQAYDAQLADISGLTPTDSYFIVGDGSNFVTESGATVRTSLGLGSLATLSSVNNDNWSGTDLAITNGGTGASTAAAAKTALGAASIKVGTYTGDGNATKAITGVGFQPSFVLIIPHAAARFGYKTNQMATTFALTHGSDGETYDSSQAQIDADGFTVSNGPTNYLNIDTQVYSYVAYGE